VKGADCLHSGNVASNGRRHRPRFSTVLEVPRNRGARHFYPVDLSHHVQLQIPLRHYLLPPERRSAGELLCHHRSNLYLTDRFARFAGFEMQDVEQDNHLTICQIKFNLVLQQTTTGQGQQVPPRDHPVDPHLNRMDFCASETGASAVSLAYPLRRIINCTQRSSQRKLASQDGY
jgi:hypothetical protein